MSSIFKANAIAIPVRPATNSIVEWAEVTGEFPVKKLSKVK